MQPIRFCRNCGASVSDQGVPGRGVPEAAFCTSCGARLAVDQETPSTDRVEGVGSSARGGFSGLVSAREAVSGAVCGLVGVVAMVAVIYIVLAVVWVFGGSAPGVRGLVGFVLLHGGGASVEVPPIDALFGIGGSLAVDPPVTSFALLPVLVFLGLGFLAARRESLSWPFVGVAALVYGLLVGLLSVFAVTSAEVSPGVTANISVFPISAGMWAFVLAGVGALIGARGARGPLFGEGVGRVITGGLVAVGASAGVAVILSILLSLTGGSDVSSQVPAQDLGLPSGVPGAPSGGDVASVGTVVGSVFALIPVGVGTVWLLANGIPVGLQNAPDLTSVPLIGEALQGIPLSASLLGEWPLGWEWRLLLLAPVAGLVLGGFVAGRGAQNPYLRGALVAVPYVLVALLVAAATRISLGISVAAVNADVSFGASYAWTLLLVPFAALLGAVGGFLGRSGAVPTPRPMRTMVVSGAAGLFVLLLALPVFLAPLSGGSGATNVPVADTAPVPDLAFEESMPEVIEDPTEMSVPEFSPEPSSDTEEVSTGDVPDPAFDSIIPTLSGMTTAEVMLPAELPAELQNVAVDSTTGGEEYGVLFLAQPPTSTVEDNIRAFTMGVISSAPDLPDVDMQYFTASDEETVELPDGTPATLRYLEPVGMSNASAYWEGRFERNGQEYRLDLPYFDPSGEAARTILTSMVPVEEVATSGQQTEQEFISQYYEAVGQRDWAATYSMLDAATQAVYTEDEWVRVQEARENTSGAAPVTDAAATDIFRGESGFTTTVELTYADGTGATLPGIEVYFEDGEFRRHLTDEELAILEQY